jgi:hypothetical protein
VLVFVSDVEVNNKYFFMFGASINSDPNNSTLCPGFFFQHLVQLSCNLMRALVSPFTFSFVKAVIRAFYRSVACSQCSRGEP